MPRRRSERGVTLVEVLVVVAIIALIAAISVASIGSMGITRLRGSAYLVAAAVQRGFSYAATHGENARLVIDLDENLLSIESGEGRLLIDKSVEGGIKGPGEDEDEESGGDGGEPAGGDDESGGDDSFEFDLGVETLTEQIRNGFHSGEVPRYKPPVFAPIAESRWQSRELEPRVTFLAVHSTLYSEAKQDGQAYIYFFPDGMGDQAVIQLTNTAGEIYSVEVLPLMGKARVYNYAYVPEFEEEEE